MPCTLNLVFRTALATVSRQAMKQISAYNAEDACQTGKPRAPPNLLSHLPILEGNNRIPQDQRHPPRCETDGTQKRPRYHDVDAGHKLGRIRPIPLCNRKKHRRNSKACGNRL
jgi:hypothetical protein